MLVFVLHGGGVKGAAHIGVIKALEEENIKFNYIAGTSSGSIIATLYSMGYTSSEIYELFKRYCKKIKYVDFRNVIKLIGGFFEGKIIIDGLNSGCNIEKIMFKACKEKNIYNINQIKKVLLIPSVDLYTGDVIVFSSIQHRKSLSDEIKYVDSVELAKAVRASCSYPGVFSPCKYKNTELIDGGIRENVPWKELKASGADRVISIVFESELKNKKDKNIIDNISSAIGFLCRELSLYELNGADCLLKIPTKNVSLLDMSKIDELYHLGYNVAKQNISKIKNCLLI